MVNLPDTRYITIIIIKLGFLKNCHKSWYKPDIRPVDIVNSIQFNSIYSFKDAIYASSKSASHKIKIKLILI